MWMKAVGVVLMFGVPSAAFASWTPLLTSGMFTGITTDLGTAAAGILAACVIVLGIGILMRALSR